MRKLFVTLFVLAVIGGLLYGADRFAAGMAEEQIGKQVAAQSGLGAPPEVEIDGFPFLTQVLAGEYEKIEMSLGEISQRNIKLTDVSAELSGVRAPLSGLINGDTSQVVAGTAAVSGIVPFSTVEKHAPQGVRMSASGSDLRLRGKLGYAGFSVPVDATVGVKAGREGITMTPKQLRGEGGRPIPLRLVQQRFGFTIPVRDLPLGARVTGVEVVDGGLRITASADDVKIAR
jgi:hypothetical protein